MFGLRVRQTMSVLALVSCLGLSFVLVACGKDGGGSNGAQTKEPVIIGYVGDFSSDYAYYEVPYRDAIEFGLEEINKNGGVLGGRPLKLVTRDSKSDVALGSKLVQEVIDEGAVCIVGTTSPAQDAQAQVVRVSGLPQTTGYSSAPTLLAKMGPQAVQPIMTDNAQGAAMAEYALSQGYKTAYLLGSKDVEYLLQLPKYFAEVFERGGGEIVGNDEFRYAAGDFSAQVTRIANFSPKPDCIFTAMFLPDTPVFLRQLRQAGVDIPVLGTDGVDDKSLLDAGEKAIDGLVFSTHGFPAPGSPVEDLYQRWEAAKGEPPVGIVVACGYDEIHFIAQAIEDAGSTDPEALLEAMKNVYQADAVCGSLKMNPETRMAEKAVTLVRLDGVNFVLEGTVKPEWIPDPAKL